MPETFALEQKDILLRVAEGDEKAFRVLYDNYHQKIFFLAQKLLKSDKEAKDVVQEIFLRLWLKRENLATVEHFSAYFNTLTRNYIFNRLRTKAIREVYLAEDEQEIHSSDTPLEKLSLHHLEKVLHQAVEDLPAQQKKVFHLSRMEGLKHEEIASQLQISKETVKKHMMEALRTIKFRLGQNGISMSLVLLIRVFFIKN